jgi:hypothetical protein
LEHELLVVSFIVTEVGSFEFGARGLMVFFVGIGIGDTVLEVLVYIFPAIYVEDLVEESFVSGLVFAKVRREEGG